MKLQFKKQQYQWDAVESTVQVFSGQPNQGLQEYVLDQGRYYIVTADGKRIEDNRILHAVQGYSNQEIRLSDPELLDNLQTIQAANNINISPALSNNLGRIALDIEMETGTGKTYVYIKTMFELNKRYGWTKFIVVVPSIAIREGVKKSFEITEDHFMEEYGKKARYFIYNSDNLTQIDTFSTSSDISVMIINTQAFASSLKEGAKNKASLIIYSPRDNFGSRRPIDVIAANRPIVILDEPQKMGGNATQKSLQQFKPLFTLNYSATHKDVHNPVYVLDALDAYKQKLVKKIEVMGFELKNIKGTDRYLFLENIILSKNQPPMARVEYEYRLSSGTIKRQTANLCQNEDLYYRSNELNEYQNCRIQEILPNRNMIVLSDGTELHIGEAIGNVTAEHKARIQIRETILAHLRKEQINFHKGIKTLSLFFLDEVKNYRLYDEEGNQLLGRYGKIFEEEYQNIYNDFRTLNDPDYAAYLAAITPAATHAGYFSIDKKGHAINSEVKRGETFSDDISAYDLILRKKEVLLNLDVPVRFIFSHSALREGWDNPNVFQICSLRQSNSATQKRQEVGRGLRLCVNSAGVRQDLETLGENSVQQINCLTVIASEGYADFVGALQSEIRENLYSRPMKADTDFFIGKKVKVGEEVITIDKGQALEIYFQLRSSGYVTKAGEVTSEFRKALAENKLEPLKEELEPLTDVVYKLVQSIFDPTAIEGMIENAHKTTITNNLNDNAKKREWLELWNKLNHKYAYTVTFDSEQLIEKSVICIDAKLQVSELSYRKTVGEQKDGVDFVTTATGENAVKINATTRVKYDLIGQIAKGTVLTRQTVATILSKIRPQKFLMYHRNPEEFIASVIKLIKEQKASMIVEHIRYNQVEGTYDTSIFTEEKHQDYSKAYQSTKSIQDYVFTDGYAKDGQSVERKLAEALDHAAEVVVYAKLPKGFHIPTPVGNYSPDWAIAFKEGTVQHVYFVAETKGSLESMQLTPIEQAKIDCAEKLFNNLPENINIHYAKISDYDSLLKAVNGNV